MKKSVPYLILAAIAVLVMLLWGFAGWQAGVAAAVIAALSLYLTAVILRDFYGGSPREAFRHLMGLLIPRGGGTLVVGEGKLLQPEAAKQKRPLFGPRELRVRAESAAVTVLHNDHRLYGPGRYHLEPFEEVKYIYDLRPRHKTFIVDDVLSQDRLLATFHVSAAYAPDVPWKDKPEPVWLSAEDPQGVKLQLLAQPGWENAARLAVERAIRRYAVTMPMENVFTNPEARYFDEAEANIKRAAQASLQERGIYLSYVDIEAISPKAGASMAPEAGWKERARQEGVRECLDALATGISKVPGTQLRTAPSFETAVREMLKALRAKKENQAVFTPEMNRRLQDLQ